MVRSLLRDRRWQSSWRSAKAPRRGADRRWDQHFTLEIDQMAFRPLHDRVLVRRIEEEGKTAGGIIIPDTAKEKPQEGEVIATGAGSKNEEGKVTPLDVKAGDRILFGKWSGSEVKIDGEDYLIMKESDILGIIEGAKSSKKKAA
jgi:chaperonin GroES